MSEYFIYIYICDCLASVALLWFCEFVLIYSLFIVLFCSLFHVLEFEREKATEKETSVVIS